MTSSDPSPEPPAPRKGLAGQISTQAGWARQASPRRVTPPWRAPIALVDMPAAPPAAPRRRRSKAARGIGPVTPEPPADDPW